MCNINRKDAYFRITLDKIYRHLVSFIWERNLNEFNQQIQSWKNYALDVVWGQKVSEAGRSFGRHTCCLIKHISSRVGKTMKKLQ